MFNEALLVVIIFVELRFSNYIVVEIENTSYATNCNLSRATAFAAIVRGVKKWNYDGQAISAASLIY